MPSPQLKHQVLALEAALLRLGDQSKIKQVLRLIVDTPALWEAIEEDPMKIAVAYLLGSVSKRLAILREQIDAAGTAGQDPGNQQPSE